MMFVAPLAACTIETIVVVGAGAGGPDTGAGGDGASTPDSGAGGDGASTPDSGAGGIGTGGIGTGGDGIGGTGGETGCEAREPRVFACVDLPDPEDWTAPRTFAFSGTVTAVRPPGPDELCSIRHSKIGGAAPEVMIDLADETGNALTVGFAVPGFASSAVVVGDELDVDFSSSFVMFFDWGGDPVTRIRLERDGELVVAVGESDPIGLTIGEGERACYSEDNFCGTEERAMVVSAGGEPAVSIANGETAEVGALTVTNDVYFKNYETGGCNFSLSVEYIVSAAPTP
ncbi:hypothetical protein WMF30_09030 [Sorangium sp. So ce134]